MIQQVPLAPPPLVWARVGALPGRLNRPPRRTLNGGVARSENHRRFTGGLPALLCLVRTAPEGSRRKGLPSLFWGHVQGDGRSSRALPDPGARTAECARGGLGRRLWALRRRRAPGGRTFGGDPFLWAHFLAPPARRSFFWCTFPGTPARPWDFLASRGLPPASSVEGGLTAAPDST